MDSKLPWAEGSQRPRAALHDRLSPLFGGEQQPELPK